MDRSLASDFRSPPPIDRGTLRARGNEVNLLQSRAPAGFRKTEVPRKGKRLCRKLQPAPKAADDCYAVVAIPSAALSSPARSAWRLARAGAADTTLPLVS